jgi:hypothetical protein
MKHTPYSGVRSAVYGVAILCAFLALSCESELDDDTKSLPLSGPRSVQLTARNSALVAQWTKVASAQAVAPDYEVYFSTSSNSGSAAKFETVAPGESNLVTSTITGLVNHQAYYVWVKAIFAGLGSSDFSPATHGIPVPPPPKPANLQVYLSEGLLELTWLSAEAAGFRDASSYDVFYKAGASGDVPPADAQLISAPDSGETVSGAIIASLTNNTSYRVWVLSKNTAGSALDVDAPNNGYAIIDGTPDIQAAAPAVAPTIIPNSIIPGNKKITLGWEQVHGVPSYKIYYKQTNDFSTAIEFSQPIPAASPVVTADLTGLTNSASYYVWVVSSNSKGNSAPGEPVTGTPTGKTPIAWSNAQFVLGGATAEFVFAQDLPASRFFPEGRPNTDRLTRVQETTLGNLFTDGAAWYVREILGENIDFVFLNGGFIDNALLQGTVKLGDLAGIVESGSRTDKIVLLTLTGAQLKQFFGVTDGDTPVPASVANVIHMGRGGHDTGYFGIVSKEIRYTIEYPKTPSLPGPEIDHDSGEVELYWHGRIKAGTLKFNGAGIVDGQSYRICTTDHNASGEYYLILNTGATNRVIKDVLFYRAVAEYIYDKNKITPLLDGRIKIEGGVPLPPPWADSTWIPGTSE